jgi:hypothetical protein
VRDGVGEDEGGKAKSNSQESQDAWAWRSPFYPWCDGCGGGGCGSGGEVRERGLRPLRSTVPLALVRCKNCKVGDWISSLTEISS